MIVTQDMVGKDLVLLSWSGKRGKHYKIILNSSLKQNIDKEFHVISGQAFGEL